MSIKKGESQRIYWQQWLKNSSNSREYNRRELITSSAAIRINPENAKASDVTQLLRDTLKLSTPEQEQNQQQHPESSAKSVASSRSGEENEGSSARVYKDSLVLVGTLYSLPKDYIQFEHEPPTESTDPFHVIKTLKPNDNPLIIRDRMMEHLKALQHDAPSQSSSKISPKVQWYFVPENTSSGSSIPTFIELDGYCTSMEEEEVLPDDEDEDEQDTWHGDDESDTQDHGGYYDVDLLLSRCSLGVEENGNGENGNGKCPTKKSTGSLSKNDKELRRYFQLCQVPPCSSGYLLKQSTQDPHIWRRVHCILTDDHLWYTTRVPYTKKSNTTSLRMGKRHGRISLGRALLLEPNTEYTSSPLFRVPHSFEVVNSRGTSHIFRASNRILQRQWIAALTTKIMESFENSLMDQAELIVADETIARNKRISSVAVEPLLKTSSTMEEDSSSVYLSLIRASVLRLGMEISEYREICRNIHALLPAKQAVVARSNSNGAGNQGTGKLNGSSNSQQEDAVDNARLRQIESAWGKASGLLDCVTNVALEVQQYAQHRREKQFTLSHSLETHCRHIDYVLAGYHRSNHGSETSNGGLSDPKFPPPVDLFDLLLSELQGLVHEPILT